MTRTHYRYSNGNTPKQQAEADSRYRAKQRGLRTWVDAVADDLGLTRDQLLGMNSTELLGKLLSSSVTLPND
ncbi:MULTISPECIES: hypothetical protein [Corynebacterium]|uniref:Uncharacterized protein n=1 Tax=Corynebacterium belfantii TaxID=2014537 RepID=A0ABS0LBT0_9CORY|nr:MULTISPECIES: hypothetical protein [Corynebacterium]MBG9330391.1 hypothetical protein [Corynebacterium belfantii]MBG9346285.1 hypothetical protein [Corynebacterium belfantii]MBG9354113.1 hypothetical protein [Corynebacterium belfantii]